MELKELKAVINNAPEGATHVDLDCKVTYWTLNGRNGGKYFIEEKWYNGNVSYLPSVKSIDDLRQILALTKELEEVKHDLKESMNALDVAVELCYDLDAHGVRESNPTYINLTNFIESIKK